MPHELAPTRTPWGPMQESTKVADGITFVSTASHGGFYIARALLARVPQPMQDYAASWSKGRGPQWYEEDIAAAIIPLVFPEHFKAADVDRARAMLKAVDKFPVTL